MDPISAAKAQRHLYADRRIFVSILVSLALWLVVVGPGATEGWKAEGLERVTAGTWVTAAGKVVLRHPSAGELVFEDGARFRLLSDRAPQPGNAVAAEGLVQHHFELERGRMQCRMQVSPGSFLLDVPGTRISPAVRGSLEGSVECPGVGVITVEVAQGELGLESRRPPGQAVTKAWLIPGSRVECRISEGPGIPYMTDAPPQFPMALRPEIDLEVILELAHPRDTLTLVHLLRALPEAQGHAIRSKLIQMKVPCPELAAFRQDPSAMEKLLMHARLLASLTRS